MVACLVSFCGICLALWALPPRLLARLRRPVVDVIRDPSGERYVTQLLRQAPGRRLTAAEQRQLDEDGLVVLKRLVTDEAVLETVEDAALASQSSVSQNLPHPVMFNAPVRALARHGPFGEVAASALRTPAVRVSDSDIWVRDGSEGEPTAWPWHKDMHNRISVPQPYVTVWLALTDAPDAVDWLLGSHLTPHNCSMSDDPRTLSLGVDQQCMESVWERSLSSGGAGGLRGRSFHLQRGDAVVFDGGLWHRGRSGRKLRVAVDFRFVPAGLQFAGALSVDGLYRSMYHRHAPRWCEAVGGPLFPLVFPKDQASFDHDPWPVVLTFGDMLSGALGLSEIGLRWALGGYGAPRCVGDAVVFDAAL